MPKTTPKSIRSLSNRELLAERKLMQSGRYFNVKTSNKTWLQHINVEITHRKKEGLMKKTAGKKSSAHKGFFW